MKTTSIPTFPTTPCCWVVLHRMRSCYLPLTAGVEMLCSTFNTFVRHLMLLFKSTYQNNTKESTLESHKELLQREAPLQSQGSHISGDTYKHACAAAISASTGFCSLGGLCLNLDCSLFLKGVDWQKLFVKRGCSEVSSEEVRHKLR